MEEAKKVQYKATKLISALFKVEGGYFSAEKHMMTILTEVDVGTFQYPAKQYTSDDMKMLKKLMRNCEVEL